MTDTLQPPLPDTSAPALLALDTAEGNATQSLYQAAIGPVNTERYLQLFTRFEAADRAVPSWNWAACLCTFGWMVFRRMGVAALVYLGVASVLLLLAGLLVVVGFQGAPEMQWGAALVIAVLLLVAPGLRGDAWLYAHTRKRMARALADSASWSDAASLLGRQTVTWPRAAWVVLGHLVLLGGAAAVYLTLPGNPAPAAPGGPDVRQVVETVAPAVGPAAAASAPAAVAASVPVVLPAQAPAVAAPASVPASAAPLVAAPVAPASVPVQAPPAAASAPATPAATAASPAVAASRPASAARSPVADAVTKPVPARSDAKAKPASGPYLVNVGLFAVEANARAAHARLRAAGLPATVDELQMRNGLRLRVRAGPFATRAAAEAAARRIRAMGLEAQLPKPGDPPGR